MGQPKSKFDNPWRDLPTDRKAYLDFVKTYKPENGETSILRILLHGPVGAGKSSIINSVESVVSGRICVRNPVDAASSTSFSKEYKTYQINKGGGKRHCSFVFTDTMGLESGGGGASEEDMKLALRGHVNEGYKFNPDRPLTEGDEGYNSSPSLADKVHVLAVVIPVPTIEIMNDDVWRKLRKIRLAARDLGIPQVAILTKVDDACPDAKANVRDVYRSIYLKKQVDKFHQQLGLPINCIFLVKNYVSEVDTSEVMDAQILLALRQMINYGDDYLNNL